MTPNNGETPMTPNATQSRAFTPPPIGNKRRRDLFDTPLADLNNMTISNETSDSIDSIEFKSPERKRLIPALNDHYEAQDTKSNSKISANSNPNSTHPSVPSVPKKNTFKDDSPSNALELSPGRGNRRFNIMETPPDVPRDAQGVSQNTNKTLDIEYDFNDPTNSNDESKKKRNEEVKRRSQATVNANIQRLQRGGARLIKDKKTGETVYGLLDKNSGSEKIYKYRKNFEKAVLKQKGGFDILSALGLSTNPTKTASAPVSRTRASPSNHQQGAPRRPVPRQVASPSTCGPRSMTMTPTKIPANQYIVKKKGGYPEKVYEYYIPKTRRKRFLLDRTQPNKVYDQLNDVSVDRLVKGIVGFPGKTLDRATGQFLK